MQWCSDGTFFGPADDRCAAVVSKRQRDPKEPVSGFPCTLWNGRLPFSRTAPRKETPCARWEHGVGRGE